MPMKSEQTLSEFDRAVIELRLLLHTGEPLTESQHLFIENRLTMLGMDLKVAARRAKKHKKNATSNEGTIDDELAA